MIKKVILITVIILVVALIYNNYPEQKLPENSKVDLLVVKKSENKLMAYADGQLLKTYQISLGDSPMGHKEFEGDEKTPEGVYTINAKNDKSGYHKNLGVSYPNEKDIAHAKSIGKPPGGDIKIHGIRNGLGIINKFQRLINWTNGCIALTNSEVDELYASVKIGTKIEIKP
ncbi:L,D-transpeptidase family protein [Pedobacter petrophilus]|uniref:L,D-transpeptidase family protein n=1 Tax=Pedobacter petrophilus TaxID=1908241 RepID=A0A7K0FY98_9SPHI|nr:L,D-transpeptidase family protein [Pedobacter petrophilus]MRX76567.1 L,D-transpeptidase family protein [Pedobacter petrophilus]